MNIPSSQELRDRLVALGHAQVQDLARRSSVPFTTLWKIRSGETSDPRLETVRQLWPQLDTDQPSEAEPVRADG